MAAFRCSQIAAVNSSKMFVFISFEGIEIAPPWGIARIDEIVVEQLLLRQRKVVYSNKIQMGPGKCIRDYRVTYGELWL
jgi:hypothetical protein